MHAILCPFIQHVCQLTPSQCGWRCLASQHFSFFRFMHQSTTFIASERLLIKFTRMAPEKCVSVFSDPSCVIFSVASSQRYCVGSIFQCSRAIFKTSIARNDRPCLTFRHRLNVCSLDVLAVVFCNHGVSKYRCCSQFVSSGRKHLCTERSFGTANSVFFVRNSMLDLSFRKVPRARRRAAHA